MTPPPVLSLPAVAAVARRVWLALAVLALAATSAVALAVPDGPAGAGLGTGNPRLAVSNITVTADQVADITVTGTDYLVPPHAEGTPVFGGVYVFFGWVANPGRFGPSIRNSSNNDGTFGVTYAYPGDGGDPGTRDPGNGTMRLVSFTAAGESGAATDFHMDRNGNWTTRMRIYGSTFTYTHQPTGETRTVDCQQVQCGVFTIGAHGKASATNEKFAPVSFVGVPPPAPIRPGGGGGGGGGGGTTPVSPSGPSGAGPGTPAAPGGGDGTPSSPGPSDGGTTTTTDRSGSDPDATGSGPGDAGDDDGTGPDDDGTADALEAAAGASTTLPDGSVVTAQVSSSRSTGSGAGLVLLAVVIGLVAVAVAVGLLLRWRRARPTPVEVEL